MSGRSPVWWRNFVSESNSNYSTINRNLSPYNATFIVDGPLRYLDFKTDGDHTIFILRFNSNENDNTR